VALSGDGKHALTGSHDQTAILWDLDSGKALQTLKGHTNAISSVALSSDGKHAITGSRNNTAILWNLGSGKALQTLKGHNGFVSSVAFRPDNAIVITASWDGTGAHLEDGTRGADPLLPVGGRGVALLDARGLLHLLPNGENLIAWKIKDDSPQAIESSARSSSASSSTARTFPPPARRTRPDQGPRQG